jgi:hypothetical protein
VKVTTFLSKSKSNFNFLVPFVAKRCGQGYITFARPPPPHPEGRVLGKATYTEVYKEPTGENVAALCLPYEHSYKWNFANRKKCKNPKILRVLALLSDCKIPLISALGMRGVSTFFV